MLCDDIYMHIFQTRSKDLASRGAAGGGIGQDWPPGPAFPLELLQITLIESNKYQKIIIYHPFPPLIRFGRRIAPKIGVGVTNS